MQADRDFYQSVVDHDYEAFRALVHPEAVFLGSRILRGRDAVAESWRSIVSGETDIRWAPDEAHISTAGDLGYTIGTAEYRIPDEAGEIELETATYVTIWRRTATGDWQAVLDIGTPPEPATGVSRSPD
jgi:ketosteroid isomerase-like protein